jgi:hypothetical protein
VRATTVERCRTKATGLFGSEVGEKGCEGVTHTYTNIRTYVPYVRSTSVMSSRITRDVFIFNATWTCSLCDTESINHMTCDSRSFGLCVFLMERQ